MAINAQILLCFIVLDFFTTDIVQEAGFDVFGQPPMKKPVECACPNCQRFMASNRFAPHLEKCMGMGRNSSRIASRRCVQCTYTDVSLICVLLYLL